MKLQIFLLFLFFFLQVSFLPHITYAFFAPNFVLLYVIALAAWEPSKKTASLSVALAGGFLLDAFSQKPFGFWMFLLAAAVFLTRYIIANYVRLPFFRAIS